MPEVNAVGDLVLTRTQEFRALADPLALALSDRLSRDGPATTAALAASTEAPETQVAERLDRLAHAGLVTRSTDGWSAVANGFVFELPDDPDALAAARALSNVMLLQYVDLPRRWVAETEPLLEQDWARASGLFNSRVALTPDELRALQEQLEELLAPYLTRDEDDWPAGTRHVRVLGYFMPEASPG